MVKGGELMREAVIVAGARTPVGKAKKGSLATVRPDDFGALVVKETLKRAGGYDGPIDDLIIGCAMPEAEQGMNVARNIGALSRTSGYDTSYYSKPFLFIRTYNRLHMQQSELCFGHSEAIIAGGVESMSMVPMMGNTIRPNAHLQKQHHNIIWEWVILLSKLLVNMAYSREDQDAFAVRSHEIAAAAIAAGKFNDEIVPVEVVKRFVDENNKATRKEISCLKWMKVFVQVQR